MNEKEFLGTADTVETPEAPETLNFNFFENLEAASRIVEFGLVPEPVLSDEERKEIYG